jgi:hypothetical protein
MAINNAKAKAKPKKTSNKRTGKKTTPHTSEQQAQPIKSASDRSVTLRLYIKDKQLLREAKIAAIEDDTSLSQLWEEWVRAWLEKRHKQAK